MARALWSAYCSACTTLRYAAVLQDCPFSAKMPACQWGRCPRYEPEDPAGKAPISGGPFRPRQEHRGQPAPAPVQTSGTLASTYIKIEVPVCKQACRRDALVLKGLSLNIQPGKRLALVRPSGHIKSTVVSLLQRLYAPQVCYHACLTAGALGADMPADHQASKQATQQLKPKDPAGEALGSDGAFRPWQEHRGQPATAPVRPSGMLPCLHLNTGSTASVLLVLGVRLWQRHRG